MSKIVQISKKVFSRKPQIIILVSLALFLFYFSIIHNIQENKDPRKSYSKIKNLIEICNLIKNRNCQRVKFKETVDVRRYIDISLEEAFKEDKGTGCDIPKLDPFAKELMKFVKNKEFVKCAGKDWVRCHKSTCRVIPQVLAASRGLKCAYRDIIYDHDYKRHLGDAVELEGNSAYVLTHSDHVKITCTARYINKNKFAFNSRIWSGHGVGFRTSVKRKPPPKGRRDNINVLIFGFDSTSKNGFIRKMPQSYKVLTEELNFTILNGYNIVGDATIAALTPLLTGRTELELPEVRKSIKNSGYVDRFPLLFYKFRDDGFRTAYFEDMPGIGTFQFRFNGFLRQPADHYLRPFYMEDDAARKKRRDRKNKFSYYCVGDTPRHELMMNITDQFLSLDGKKFIFTFIADITHDDFNMITTADAATARFLRTLRDRDRLRYTLVIVMGDHGPRYTSLRKTFQGKLEERLPLMAIRLPEELKRKRPQSQAALEKNADVLTSPHDIYATVLDAVDMRQYWNPHKIRGSNLTRGLTILEPIPSNRSCSEAGIQPHWCTCLKWEHLDRSDPLFTKAARALVDQINNFTESVRHLCAVRTLLDVQWVMKKKANKAMIEFQGARDHDGYVGKFGGTTKIVKLYLQARIAVGPGRGEYEASMNYNIQQDKFIINNREISRTNAYKNEPSCISDKYPHLNMYCYCKVQTN